MKLGALAGRRGHDGEPLIGDAPHCPARPRAKPSQDSGGRRSIHGAAVSSCAATRSSRSSRASAATICTPTGSPAAQGNRVEPPQIVGGHGRSLCDLARTPRSTGDVQPRVDDPTFSGHAASSLPCESRMERLVESLGVTILSESQACGDGCRAGRDGGGGGGIWYPPSRLVRTVRGRRRAGLKVRENGPNRGCSYGGTKASGRNGLQE